MISEEFIPAVIGYNPKKLDQNIRDSFQEWNALRKWESQVEENAWNLSRFQVSKRFLMTSMHADGLKCLNLTLRHNIPWQTSRKS